MGVKHEKEILAFLRELLYDKDSMSEEEYQYLVEETYRTTGITQQEFSDNLEEGIKNGHTIEQQFDLVRKNLNIN